MQPIDMLLYCPHCLHQHVDLPQPEINWDNPPHRSHLCQFCGHVWRPADVPTNGVQAIQTQGTADKCPAPLGDGETDPERVKIVVEMLDQIRFRLSS